MSAYPPLRLRRHAGSLGVLDGPGHEFVALLKLLAGLESGQKIWDMGCGCGLLELALEPSFLFLHSDVYHPAYWLKGRLNVHQWLDQFPGRDFDVIIAKSFFTHVLPDELDAYLSAVAQRLKPDTGRALLTFFALSSSFPESLTTCSPSIRFHPLPEAGYCAVRHASAPSAAEAYDVEYLRRKFKEHSLSIQGDFYGGWWRGYPDGLSFQDVFVLSHTAQPGRIRIPVVETLS